MSVPKTFAPGSPIGSSTLAAAGVVDSLVSEVASSLGSPALPARVLQTDFTAGSGNALQACVASLLGTRLEDTPNFVTLPSYESGIREFCAPRSVEKIALPANLEARAGQLCILRGQSPRGTHGHVVIARCAGGGDLAFVWDPHPDASFLAAEAPYGWAMFIGEGGL